MAGLLLLLAMVGAIALTVDIDARYLVKTQIMRYNNRQNLHSRITYWQVSKLH